VAKVAYVPTKNVGIPRWRRRCLLCLRHACHVDRPHASGDGRCSSCRYEYSYLQGRSVLAVDRLPGMNQRSHGSICGAYIQTNICATLRFDCL
jgi:hypothetical protein